MLTCECLGVLRLIHATRVFGEVVSGKCVGAWVATTLVLENKGCRKGCQESARDGWGISPNVARIPQH